MKGYQYSSPTHDHQGHMFHTKMAVTSKVRMPSYSTGATQKQTHSDRIYLDPNFLH